MFELRWHQRLQLGSKNFCSEQKIYMEEKLTGKIQVYTGDGKGKTTAALGLSIRAISQGLNVKIVYFDKGGDFYGERKILDFLIAGGHSINYQVTGLPRFNPETQKFRFGVTDDDKAEGKKGLEIVKEIFASPEKTDILILDEINPALALGIIELAEVLEILQNKPEKVELILTGRNAHNEVVALADLVTEMKPVKHYFDQGLSARKGIEY
jgi:cob(I)alamin adenosyltransferase